MAKIFVCFVHWCVPIAENSIWPLLDTYRYLLMQAQSQAFPGGSAVKNLPARADPTCHRAPQLLNLCSGAWELQLPRPSATITEACAS